MKDYFDLWVLLRTGELNPKQLRSAIEATFARRGTALPATTPVGLDCAFAQDQAKNAQWAAFLKRNRLEGASLTEVIAAVRMRIDETNS